MRSFRSIHRQRGSVSAIAFALAVTVLVAGAVPSAAATSGPRLWVARYHNPAGGDAAPFAIAVSPDGTRVYVTGRTLLRSAHPITAAYDAASGAEIWLRRFSGNGTTQDLAVSPDGAIVYVTGRGHVPGSSDDYLTFAYDAASGATIWGRRYRGPANSFDVARALAVSPDGSRVYVTGSSSDPGSGTQSDFLTLAYDAASGSKIWARRYNGRGNGNESGREIAASPDGTRVYVTGDSDNGAGSGMDYATVALDSASGSRIWVRRYNGRGNGDDFPEALAVSPDGTGVYVTGYSLGSGTLDSDYLTIAYDAGAGSTTWTRRFNGPEGFTDFARDLAVSPDGTRVYVTGYVLALDGSSDDVTFSYDAATGATVWARGYDGPSNGTEFANALALSPDGTRVYVTGEDDASSGDFLTTAYDAASGSKIWGRLYNGTGNETDFANALAVSPDGTRVYVTGPSFGSGPRFDFATVAYTAG
jgi:DNA-binding beta-propeller fold protein YncE